jgi:hypothetical protein
MPPRCNRQPPAHNLSWFSAHRHWVAVRSVLEIEAHDRRLLERFRHHVQLHDIPYFHSSHQVFVLGPHLRQYFRTSLRSLLTLDYVPRKVKIPTNHVPHECCPLVNPHNTPFGAPHQRPFEYILAISRSRGRPRRETDLPVSSELESESESEFDSEDLVENSDTDNSVFNPGPNSDMNNSGVIRITRL